MRAAIYCRVSSEEQAKEGYSIPAQERACADYCQQRNWDIIGKYVDEGKSANTDVVARRPAFRALLDAVHARKIDVIVVHKFDRFSRSMAVTIEAFRLLSLANCGFVSITEQFDYTTPQGRLFLHMLAALAEFYSQNLSQETRKGKLERKRQGLYNGLLPFGLIKGEDGLPTEDRRPLVGGSTNYDGLLLAFQAAAAGASDADVARRLNAAGYRTTGNRGLNLFTKDTVRRILVNRFYLGELPDGKGGWIKGKHRSFLDVELFEQAQLARAQNRKRAATRTTSRGTTYSLSGLLRCGHCGGAMHIARWHDKEPRAFCYARSQGKDCCQHSMILSAYEQQFGEWLATVQIPETEAKDAAREVISAQPVGTMQQERSRLETRLKRLLDAYTWGDISAEEYQAERDSIKAQLASLPSERQRVSVEKIAKLVSDVQWVWRYGTDKQRNELVSTLVERIVVQDGTIVEIVPRSEITSLISANRGGSDGHRIAISKRYLIPHCALPPAFNYVIAQTALAGTINSTARYFGVARQTVRKAISQSNPEPPGAAQPRRLR